MGAVTQRHQLLRDCQRRRPALLPFCITPSTAQVGAAAAAALQQPAPQHGGRQALQRGRQGGCAGGAARQEAQQRQGYEG